MTEPLEPRHLDRSPMLSGLETLLQESDFAWSLDLIGEDQAGKLATLTGDLRRGVSTTGDGKRITFGFSYLGTESAIAWANACRDRLYPVMKQSIDSFDRRWRSIREILGGKPYHYVSLGPGDGQKDEVILKDLMRDNAQLCYVAVDMSTEMLRLGVPSLIRALQLSSRVLSVQLDFSSKDNVAELRHVLDALFGEEAVLFSLLGNTLTNFENDTELLRMLAGQLLRPQDRFILEVATTQQLDESLAQEAAEEYRRSHIFREFITSALMHYTDLRIDMDNILFQGGVEGERALLIKVVYQNRIGRDIRITLPDRTDVSFPQLDTIRLCVSRKYMRDRLGSLLVESGVHALDSNHFYFDGGAHNGPGFGMDLLVLRAGSETTRPEHTMIAELLWRTHDDTPAAWGKVLRQATPAPDPIKIAPDTVAEPSAGAEQRLIDVDTARLWNLVEELSPRQWTLLQTLFTDNPQPTLLRRGCTCRRNPARRNRLHPGAGLATAATQA
jgi:L-histidine N-alpha-methyltransferase